MQLEKVAVLKSAEQVIRTERVESGDLAHAGNIHVALAVRLEQGAELRLVEIQASEGGQDGPVRGIQQG
ncbi:hypothetical protein EO238_25615, partial [Citrobacter sp. AAK_AS5]